MAKDPTLTVQKGALVGDENLPEPDVEVRNITDQVDAQVNKTKVEVADKVDVHEVHVNPDHVITDPNSPEAVQIPDAGRGSLDLPLHAFEEGSVEDRFETDDE
jgi:hypothetical protein